MDECLTSTSPIMEIDVDKVLRSKAPRHYRYIPRFVVKWLERVICQDQLNVLLRANAEKRGSAFARGVLEHLKLEIDCKGIEPLDPSNPKVVIISNHPLGGLDGLVYIDVISRVYGREPYFVVNDILMAIEPLKPVFLPVNKHGRQDRESLRALDTAMDSDRPVIIFPAGLVSRKQKGGVIADLQWQKAFVSKARKHGRKVIPAFFEGENSQAFYNFAKRRTRLGLKFNIEMIYLPREVFRNANAHFNIYFGEAIDLNAYPYRQMPPQQVADSLKSLVYNLPKTYTANISDPTKI